jgi:ABC-type phosphate transport system substrate-binding protein
MRNSSTVGIAVAGILAAAAASNASAASYTLYVSGASAQRTFWESDMGFLCTGNRATPATKWTVIPSPDPGGTGINVAFPDIEAVQCTVTTSGQIGASTVLTIGDTITMQYAAELGSVWGIAPFLTSTNAFTAGRHFLDVTNPAVCPPAGGACTVTGYSRLTDASSTGLAAAVTPDLGVTDAEPSLWTAGDNWPLTATVGNSYPILANAATSKQPTSTEILAFGANPAQQRVNGQVLAIIVNTAAPTGTLTSLSKASVTSILTGKLANWGQVPEIGNTSITTPIIVCRRDHGSGTEVTASVTFAGGECAVPLAPTIVRQRNGNLAPVFGKLTSNHVIENATTNDLASCVSTNVGAVGFRSLSFSAAYVTVPVDGVEANAHNAASGKYLYAYDSWVFTGSPTLTGAKSDIATALIADAATSTALAAEPGTLTGFTWVAGTGNSNGSKGAFAGQYGPGGSGAPSFSSAWAITSGAAPESLYNQGGNSCAARVDTPSFP